jgi:hypothetical protein
MITNKDKKVKSKQSTIKETDEISNSQYAHDLNGSITGKSKDNNDRNHEKDLTSFKDVYLKQGSTTL